jgi:hypothetical protein
VPESRLTWISAGLGVMWASETLPEISLGPFARVGYGAATASHVRVGGVAHDVGGFVTTLGASAQLRAALAEDWDLWLGFDLGYTPVGVVFLAAATSGGGMAELTLALRAGLGLRF